MGHRLRSLRCGLAEVGLGHLRSLSRVVVAELWLGQVEVDLAGKARAGPGC